MKNKLFFLCLILSTLFSCGGGGGGGSSEPSGASAFGSVSNPRCSSGSPAIKIVHGGIDTSPLDIYINSSFQSTRLYGRDSFYVSINSGSVLELISRLSQTTIHSRTFNGAGSPCQTLIFTGTNERGNLNVNIINDNPIDVSSGSAIRLINATSENSTYTMRVSGLSFSAGDGGASSYSLVSSGVVAVRVSGPQSFSVSVTLDSAKHYSFILRGEASFFVDSELVVDNF